MARRARLDGGDDPGLGRSAVIGAMLRSRCALRPSRLHPAGRLLPQRSRDPAGDRGGADPRVIAVEVPADGPTTKADCLNHLYAFLVRHEAATGRQARAVVLHDAEDLVHPLELKLFDRLTAAAPGVVQLPVVPLPDPLALDRRPLLRRVRRKPRQGTGGARSGRRVHSAGRGRLRHRRRPSPGWPPRMTASPSPAAR
jgi:hypothetical protein